MRRNVSILALNDDVREFPALFAKFRDGDNVGVMTGEHYGLIELLRAEKINVYEYSISLYE